MAQDNFNTQEDIILLASKLPLPPLPFNVRCLPALPSTLRACHGLLYLTRQTAGTAAAPDTAHPPSSLYCRTEYGSECWTKQKVHNVEDDVVECTTEIEKDLRVSHLHAHKQQDAFHQQVTPRLSCCWSECSRCSPAQMSALVL